MENLTKPIKLSEIHYPVYLLGIDKPSIDNGIVYYLTIHENVEGDRKTTLSIVDDITVPEPTLSKRRLFLLKNNIKLKRIQHAIFFLGDLIKIAKRSMWFIDSSGNVFTLKKSKRVKLIFEKITKIIPIKTGGAIIEVENIPSRFKSLYLPDVECSYAGLLKDGLSYILYGFYKEKFKSTTRMI